MAWAVALSLCLIMLVISWGALVRGGVFFVHVRYSVAVLRGGVLRCVVALPWSCRVACFVFYSTAPRMPTPSGWSGGTVQGLIILTDQFHKGFVHFNVFNIF